MCEMKIETETTTTYYISDIELKSPDAIITSATVRVTRYPDDPGDVIDIELRGKPLTKSGKPDKRASTGYIHLHDERYPIQVEVAKMTGDKRVELYAKKETERHEKYKEDILKEILGRDK